MVAVSQLDVSELLNRFSRGCALGCDEIIAKYVIYDTLILLFEHLLILLLF